VSQDRDEPVTHPKGSGGLVRLRLDVAYDGAAFHGWARQPGLRTVQGEVELSLRTALRVPAELPVRLAVAGRTDAGVHATGQVCHGDVSAQSLQLARGAQALHHRLLGLLAPDVRVRAVSVAPPGFDARWSATWRRYEYVIADDPLDQDPRLRGHVLWHGRRLDEAAMQAAARPFLGEHDFAAFCRERPGASTVRTILALDWSRRVAAGPGPGLLVLTIRADAFCHSMIRALVGVFLAVGEGRAPVGAPARMLETGDRLAHARTAPAHGLTLAEVGYPHDEGLAEAANRARRWRGPASAT
jgi:tRNA pseudouridine38-40 synthase